MATTPVGVTKTAAPVGQWSVEVSHFYQNSDTVYEGTSRLGRGFMETSIHGTRVGIGYQATPHLGLSLGIPYFWELYRQEIESSTVNLSGFGDLRLMADWQVLPQDSAWGQLSLLAGINLPTGADDNITLEDRQGFALFEGFSTTSQTQLGSGTYNPLVGYSWTKPLGSQWSVGHNLLARIPLGESSKGLQAGFSLDAAVQVNYQVTEALRLSGGLALAHAEASELHGETIINTAGQVLAATLAVRWDVSTAVSLNLGTRIPIYRDLDNGQLSPGPLVYGGVEIRF